MAYSLGEAARPLIVAGAVAAVLAGYAISLRGLSRILRAAREEAADSKTLVERVRKECNYSLWQSSGVTGVFAFALAVFLLSATAASDLRESSVGAFDIEGTTTSSIGPLGPISVEGAVHAGDGTRPVPGAGTLVVEWEGLGGSRTLAEAPVELPGPGETLDFRVGGVVTPAGTGEMRVVLLVDSDFDGHADLEVASSPVTVQSTP
jgi:hypothetical protein